MATASIQELDAQLGTYLEWLWAGWDDSPPKHVYHYTSVGGMRGILGGAAFWASDIRYMNDATEEGYAWNVVRDALANRRDILSSALGENFQQHGGMPGFAVS